jgi:enoyl-CoA hydratase/carnithine racemase
MDHLTKDRVARFRDLLVADGETAARITLNRPEKRNALSLELMEEITAALRELSADADTRAIMIERAGRSFCSGHDLARWSVGSPPSTNGASTSAMR